MSSCTLLTTAQKVQNLQDTDILKADCFFTIILLNVRVYKLVEMSPY